MKPTNFFLREPRCEEHDVLLRTSNVGKPVCYLCERRRAHRRNRNFVLALLAILAIVIFFPADACQEIFR